ncbi:MAG: Sec-independent protein translocase subunit TatA/TatB [Rubrobacteraceae bacterium]
MGLPELLIVLFLVFLVVGPKRIQKLFKSLGRGVSDFKTEFGNDEKAELSEEDKKKEESQKHLS